MDCATRSTPSSSDKAMPALEIDNLFVEFPSNVGTVRAVDGVLLSVDEGEILGIVGESGSGKTIAMLAVMGLVPYPGRVRARRIALDGRDLLTMSDVERRAVAGKDMAMIFQEPATSLNPCFTVGFQIMETLRVHEGMDAKQAKARAIGLLEQVGIPAPETRLSAYPHQLSGGMNQRVMIAMALACDPRLLIADEPTTALDVTIQAQILELMRKLKEKTGAAIVLITHDLGVVAEMAQRVVVMYAGRKVEEAPVQELFARPRHPYTRGLLKSVPRLTQASEPGRRRLAEISGVVPSLREELVGCAFAARCAHATSQCRAAYPPLEEKAPGHLVACW